MSPFSVSLGFSGYVPIFHVPVFRIVSLKFRLSPGKRKAPGTMTSIGNFGKRPAA